MNIFTCYLLAFVPLPTTIHLYRNSPTISFYFLHPIALSFRDAYPFIISFTVSLSLVAHFTICYPLILPLISGSATQRSDPGSSVEDERGRCVFVARGSEWHIDALKEESLKGIANSIGRRNFNSSPSLPNCLQFPPAYDDHDPRLLRRNRCAVRIVIFLRVNYICQ